ncbi:hypothetical protein N9850_11275 [Granulosicoccus sp.]|nr:sugar-binding protein [Granulosicoccus sp.]MDB4224346.1 hypothetical protein [Granulosicoccus sp.]
MRMLNTPLSVTGSALAMSLLISACSSGGTVTTLDARPISPIGLPQDLLDATFLDRNNISPTILLSNGASVTMQRGDGDAWSGTINVAPAAQYTATVMWAESFQGRVLPLARLQQTLEVAADGTIQITETTVYSTNIDTDGDGTFNLDERKNDTDPFNAPIENNQGQPLNDDGGSQPQSPAIDSSDLDTEADASQSPTAGPAQSSTATPATAPATTTTNPVPPTVDSTPEPASTDLQLPVSPTDSIEPTPDAATALADAVIPRIATSDAPKIDGQNVEIDSTGQLTGEWAAAVQTDSSGAPLLIENLIIDITAENTDGTPYRRWAAMHDGDYLYVVVIVDDNGDRHRDTPSDLIHDDSLELFLDGDNSKSSSYDSNDFHRIFPVKLPGVDKRSANKGDVSGPNSSSANLIVSFATGPGAGPRGIRRANWEQDVYELKIDLSSASINTDETFGFELQINDDDGGNTRDSKWAWKHPSRITSDVDSTVNHPSSMGTLKLE